MFKKNRHPKNHGNDRDRPVLIVGRVSLPVPLFRVRQWLASGRVLRLGGKAHRVTPVPGVLVRWFEGWPHLYDTRRDETPIRTNSAVLEYWWIYSDGGHYTLPLAEQAAIRRLRAEVHAGRMDANEAHHLIEHRLYSYRQRAVEDGYCYRIKKTQLVGPVQLEGYLPPAT